MYHSAHASLGQYPDFRVHVRPIRRIEGSTFERTISSPHLDLDMATLAASPLRALEGPGLLHRVVELLSGPEDALFFALACRACRDAVWADARFPLVRGKR